MRKIWRLRPAYFWFLIVVFLSVLSLGPQACIAAKGDTLTAEEAKTILSELNATVKVLYVQQAPVAGLWEVGVETNGKKAILYIDHAKKHLVSGNVVDIKTKTNLTQESFQKINKVDVSKIPLKDALVLGDKTARNKIIVFSDPD